MRTETYAMEIMIVAASTRTTIRMARFICGILTFSNPIVIMPKAETITSAANPLLKDVRRAIARGGLTTEGLCVAETPHLLEEALRSHCEVKVVLVSESAAARVRVPARLQLVTISDRLFQSVAATETSQGVIALVKLREWTLDEFFAGVPLIVVLDGVQDPGNAGTIVRAAEAFGATGTMFLKGSVSPHNPKALRASSGSLFRVPCVHGLDAAAARETLAQNRVRLFAGVKAGRPAAAVDLTAPCGLVIGSEARGVGAAWRAVSEEISIPTEGVESLNAALAAGILLYEARRQRTPDS
jgi:TrmH family RNA methyltransferase